MATVFFSTVETVPPAAGHFEIRDRALEK